MPAVIITVTVRDDLGGISAPGTATITVAGAPVIASVVAVPTVVGAGGTSVITVTASSPDARPLTYTATAPTGTVTQSTTLPNVFTYRAP